MKRSDQDVILKCEGVHRAFGEHRVLGDINLELVRGQFAALVGSSGCGKSTLLNMIVGTLPASSGRIAVLRKGQTLAVEGPGQDRGIVYQHYSLYPHLTALDNIALGPMLHETSIPGRLLGRVTGAWPKARKGHLAKAKELLVRLSLEGSGHKFPSELSGGMKQRVAIACALIMEPDVLLLDEPFGALDEETRHSARALLLELYAENLEALSDGNRPAYTVLMVTHNLEEAVHVGDRVLGLSRDWDWKAEGFPRHPGASIVLDQLAPVFSPQDRVSNGQLLEEAENIYDVVFNSQGLDRAAHRTHWASVEAGQAEGVLAT